MKRKNILFWSIGFLILLLLLFLPKRLEQTTLLVDQLPLRGYLIVVDPGHGGQDGGAIAKDAERTEEKVITLAVAKMLRNYLEQAGAIVYLTRETDTDLADDSLRGLANRKSQDIRRRLQMIHDKEADFFVSIHLNSLPSSRWRGAQTFFYPRLKQNKQLAKSIQNEIIFHMENTERQALQIDQIYLLKYAKVPGALVELGFLSNESERELLKQTNYQQRLAVSIYNGILRYVEFLANDGIAEDEGL